MERETGLEPATSSLGSWHSTTELLPRSGGFSHTIAHRFVLGGWLSYFQHSPAGQRRGLVVQEHDAAGLGERQIRTDRLAIERHLLQDLAVGGVAGIEPGALAQEPAAPAE